MKLNYKVLIIDDNIIDQIVVKQLLKKKLYLTDVEVANNGKEGIKWITDYKKESGDHLLILLDIKMPQMDGFEFLEEFKKLNTTLNSNELTIVMLSSSLDPSDIKRAKTNLFVKKLLNKPLYIEELSAILEN